MVTRELIKAAVDRVQDEYVEALYKIVMALQEPDSAIEEDPPTEAEEDIAELRRLSLRGGGRSGGAKFDREETHER